MGCDSVKFLLVDDLEENRIALEALLRRDGLDVLQAAGGAEALELLLKHDVALALLDVQMPEMDGFELAEIMRGTERTRRVPIIFLTAGGPDNQRRFRGYEAGAVDFIYKPIEPHVLQSKAGVFFDLYRQRAEVARHRDALVAAARENARLLDVEKELRARAEQEGRAKDDFLATLSHELRTPLNAILGWTQLIGSGALSADESREGMTVIERNARTQASLIDDLLDMSRIISGRIRIDPQPVDIADVIDSAIQTVLPIAEAKQVLLNSRDIARPIVVSGDSARLQQIVWNLLTNAVKFTPAGGEVRVLLGVEADQAVLQVCDTGIGLSADFLPFVFERFRQADGSTTRRQGGLGLGLSIVRDLVHLHGGSVQASSDGPGQGATFALRLPMASVLPPAAPEQIDEDASSHQLHGLRILIVDDETDSRDVLRLMLEQSGAVVDAAPSVHAAMQRLAVQVPELIISDIGMPVEDGYELIRRVRTSAVAEVRHLPAIALTAFAHPEDGDRVLAAGFQAHLTKPLNHRKLIDTAGTIAAAGAARR